VRLATPFLRTLSVALGSTFGGWQGCDHPSGLACVMDMHNTEHSKKLSATFK
jgi:hypothetical protein